MTTAVMTRSVREATVDDLDRIVEMGHAFLRETPYRDRIAPDPDHMRQLASTVMDLGALFVAESQGRVVGMFGVLVMQHPTLNRLVGEDVIWWVDHDARPTGAGLRLLRAAETWAVSQGAKSMLLSVYHNSQVARLYERLGYRSCEEIFEKELEP